MKSHKLLIPLVVVLLFGLSLYYMASNAFSTASDYNKYLEQAREQAAVGTVSALDFYEKALEINPTADVYIEVADYFKNNGLSYDLIKWCRNMIETYPNDSRGYEYIIEAYAADEKYDKCYDYLFSASKRKVSSEKLDELSESLKYVYHFDYTRYNDASVFSNNLSAVCSEEKWGFVNRYGVSRVRTIYKEVGVFTNSGLAPVVDQEGNAYFINIEGEKALATLEKYKKFGNISDDLFPAMAGNGKYLYLNEKFEAAGKNSYDYASTFNQKIAAVKTGSQWSLIDTKENVILDGLKEVVLDEKGIAARNDRCFVSNDGSSYIMVDLKGNRVGNGSYEAVRIFNDSTYAAVRVNNKWGFIDKDGNYFIEPSFEEARSFSCGLAAVKTTGDWGFIDESGSFVIAPTFEDAKDFNAKGSCFVQIDGTWRLLEIYRLNRED